MTRLQVPCPNCTDGFTTTGDRHARTAKDVCPHCAGTGIVEARTGETPQASYRPAKPACSHHDNPVGTGKVAYEARFSGLTLGARGASPAWAALPDDARRTWAIVERQVLAHACTEAMLSVMEERARQIREEGWTLGHDDIHTDGALARAAAAYAVVGSLSDRVRACLYPSSWGAVIRSLWPASWDETWFKPKDRRHDLVRAGALIAAEIERIDRAGDAAL